MLYLHLLPPASVVCCFHRKLARRPLRWISCIARYLPVKVFYGFCIHLLLSVSLALFLVTSPCDPCNCTFSKMILEPGFSLVLSKISTCPTPLDVCRYVIEIICWLRNQLSQFFLPSFSSVALNSWCWVLPSVPCGRLQYHGAAFNHHLYIEFCSLTLAVQGPTSFSRGIIARP